jgi:hypothetical protein
VSLGRKIMIDLDIYHTNETVENFLQSLKLNLNKDYPTTKVYISTANPNNNWLQKQYIIYNEVDKYDS